MWTTDGRPQVFLGISFPLHVGPQRTSACSNIEKETRICESLSYTRENLTCHTKRRVTESLELNNTSKSSYSQASIDKIFVVEHQPFYFGLFFSL